jgi:hypothetical protein
MFRGLEEYGKWIAAGGFLLAMFALDWFSPSPLLTETNYQQTYGETNEQREGIASGESSDNRIADYTLVLAVFTGVLAAISIWQGMLLRKADETARVSANAAKQSADATLIAERCYVYPEVTDDGALHKVARDSRIYWLNGDAPSPIAPVIKFRIKNYGKTPAILKEVFAAVGIWPVGAEFGVGIKDPVIAEKESTRDISLAAERGLTANEWAGLLAYTDFLVFIGRITFQDIWENDFRTEFRFHWDHNDKGWQIKFVRTVPASEALS